MQLKPQDAAVIQRALAALDRGDGRGFDDALWLGFGDACGPMFNLLEQGKYVLQPDGDVLRSQITPRGRELLARLRRQSRAGLSEGADQRGSPGAPAKSA